MGKIHLLPDHLINQIAAGEVVERPLSVVKELIENAIDADADEIVVELEKGGKGLIRMRDNGCGMTEEDIYMALERHATSKLKKHDDILAINTMGFRGEALPSIASVSHFTIRSATAHGTGQFVTFRSGQLIDNGDESMPRGTDIEVKNLFFNIPVRKKFLKSDEREFALIRELVQKFSILYPHIAFTMIHNGRSVFTLPKGQDRNQRILTVWKASENDIQFSQKNFGATNMNIVLGSPTKTFRGTSVISVNGRIISDRKINAVMYKVFREIIGGEFRATMVLMIELPYNYVDVNVHPTKLEIRFREERAVLHGVEEIIKDALVSFRKDYDTEKPEYTFNEHQASELKSSSYNHVNAVRHEYSPGNNIFSSDNNIRSNPLEKGYRSNRSADSENVNQNPVESGILPFDTDYETVFRDYKVVGTAFSLYIIVEMNDILYFIDQHASHERITYKKLIDTMSVKSGLSQLTLQAETIQLSPEEMDVYLEHQKLFSDIGFVLETFDDQSLILRGVPALSVEADWIHLIKDMLGELRTLEVTSAWNDRFLSFVATKACHRSVRHNDTLSNGEIRSLIDDINNQEVLTCPHGRPFFFSITKKDIEKKVLRS